MKFSFDWFNITNRDRAEMVFEGRNKEYGGYVIRRDYVRSAAAALLISLLLIVGAFVAPLITSYLSNLSPAPAVKLNDDQITLADVPPIDKIAPPPPAEPPPPVQKTIKFTPPVVVEDEKVEDPPPTQEETKEVQVSTETVEGVDIVDLPPEPQGDADEGKVFTVVEEMPSFPGGESKLFEYLSKIKYPTMARENNISGRVYVTFVVDKDGKIKDAKVLRGIGGGCDEEALRVVRAMPDWKPGRQNGRNVSVQYNLPVNFSLK